MWQLPIGEKQRVNFETDACGIFSVCNAIESQLLGIEGWKDFNISDRFIAMHTGKNAFPYDVVEMIKKIGFISEDKLPMSSNINTYFDKKYLTNDMLIEAKKVLEKLSFNWEYVKFTNGKENAVEEALKECPLVGVLKNSNGTTHAVMIPDKDHYFDSYEPFLKRLDYNRLHYALKVIVKPLSSKYKYFSAKEIVGLKPELVVMLDQLREDCGFPLIINSGFRTGSHNAEVGGVENSAHTTGLAVDIRCEDSVKRFKTLEFAFKRGFRRIGVGSTFLHLDIDKTKPQGVVWLY